MTATPLQRNAEFRTLCDQFRHVLNTAAAQRHIRQGFTPSGETGWVAYERECMHSAVCAERVIRGLPKVPLEAIEAVEQQAVGHSDYVAHFAIGCARLVLDGESR